MGNEREGEGMSRGVADEDLFGSALFPGDRRRERTNGLAKLYTSSNESIDWKCRITTEDRSARMILKEPMSKIFQRSIVRKGRYFLHSASIGLIRNSALSQSDWLTLPSFPDAHSLVSRENSSVSDTADKPMANRLCYQLEPGKSVLERSTCSNRGPVRSTRVHQWIADGRANNSSAYKELIAIIAVNRRA